MAIMTRPTLYLFMGYPGAGKTTVARIIREATDGVHLWADFERHVLFDEVTHSREESRVLYDHLNHTADDLLAQGRCVIYDTNFNFRADRDKLRAIAARHGANTVVIWMTTDRELARKRATEESTDKDTRVWGNMELTDFNRLSDHLQEPDSDEQVIQIDGAHISESAIRQKLGI